MAGVDDLQRLLAHGDGVAVVQPAVGLEGLDVGEAEHLALLRHALDPEAVLLRPLDRHAESRASFAVPPGVVDVAVGDEDLLDRDAELGDRGEDAVEVAARSTTAAPSCVAPQDAAVLLERG